MAETSGEGGVSQGGGWLGSWIQTAKEKSVEAISFVKRDLAEFTTTMQDDSARVAATMKEKLTQENASQATEKVRQGVSSLIGGISKALVVEPTDNYRPARIIGGEAVVFDRQKARLHALQTSSCTYTEEPGEESYVGEWRETFSVENKKGEISELLVSNVEIRSLYTQLVPITVSNVDFWCRYYYRLHLLEEDEARRRELKKRAELSCQLNDNDDISADIDWDDDDDDDNDDDEETRSSITSGMTSSSSHVEPSSGTSQTSPDSSKAPVTSLNHSTDGSTTVTPAVAVEKVPKTGRAGNRTSDSTSHPTSTQDSSSTAAPGGTPEKRSSTVADRATGPTGAETKAEVIRIVSGSDHSPVLPKEVGATEVRKKNELASEAAGKQQDDASGRTVVVGEREISGRGGGNLKGSEDMPLDSQGADNSSTPPDVVSGKNGNSVASCDVSAAISSENAPHSVTIPADHGTGEISGGGVGNTSARTTPSDTKESTDDDWEKDFDVEISDAELKTVQELARSRAAAADTAAATTAAATTAAADTADGSGSKADDKVEDWEEW